MTVKLVNHRKGNEKEFESVEEAEDKKGDMVSLGVSPEHLEIIKNGEESEAQSESEAKEPEVVEEPEEVEPVEPTEDVDDALDQLGEELDTDPLSILPDHMKDDIKGTPAVNKRGYAMIAERYGISTSAEVVEFPWENDENRCVASAKAITEDGKEYSGWASASSEDGDMEDQLIELAETRALKRSVSWASGVGIVSYQELRSELE